MANPCCPKCSGTHFAKQLNTGVGATLIYCSKCGSVLAAIPAKATQAANSAGNIGPIVGGWNRPTN
jgi:uncharacterized Zn finger protein